MWHRQKSVSPRGDADVFPRGYVCVHVCARVIREIKPIFQDNTISLYHLYIIYTLNPVIFCHVGLCFSFKMCR